MDWRCCSRLVYLDWAKFTISTGWLEASISYKKVYDQGYWYLIPFLFLQNFSSELHRSFGHIELESLSANQYQQGWLNTIGYYIVTNLGYSICNLYSYFHLNWFHGFTSKIKFFKGNGKSKSMNMTTCEDWLHRFLYFEYSKNASFYSIANLWFNFVLEICNHGKTKASKYH